MFILISFHLLSLNANNNQKSNIIHLKKVLNCEPDPILIMKLLLLRNLAQIFREKRILISHDIASNVMKQLFNILKCLYRLSIVHTSIQLKNMLVFSEQSIRIKLTDFEFFCCGEQISYSRSVCSVSEFWEKRYRGGVAPSIWENILMIRGYIEKRFKPSCDNAVNVWNVGVICSQLIFGKILCYFDSGKSREEQVVDYVDLLLAARLENYAERFEAWAQKLEISPRSIPLLLLRFLQKLFDPKSKSRIKTKNCLIDA